MSIQSEINRISGNVANALTAIANKGVTVPQGSNSDDLATLIAQISGGGTGAISIVDTPDAAGGTVRTITATDISDTTAVAGDVAQGKYFYTAAGVKTAGTASGGGGATQHVIHLEFDDSTTANVNVYYDDSLIGAMITAYTPSPWTYNNKMVVEAQLDGVTWYEYSPIPIGVELVDYTTCVSDTAIGSDGSTMVQEWYYTSDYTAVDPSMTFSYRAGTWFYIGFYTEAKTTISALYVYTDGTQDPSDSNTAYGTLAGKIPSNAAYVRLCGTWYDSAHMSLIRTA